MRRWLARFATKRPILFAMLAGVLYLPWMLAYFLAVVRPMPVPVWVHAIVLSALHSAGLLVLGAALTMMRLRSGIGARRLLWLVLLLPAELVAMIVAFVAVMTPMMNPTTPFLEGFASVVFAPYFWRDVFLFAGHIYHAPAVLMGIDIGYFVARHMIRTGRWETVVPVDGPASGPWGKTLR